MGFPLRSVPSCRMKSRYVFQDGKTAGQEKGGFKAAEDAIDINWLITPQNAPIAVSKTDKMRILTRKPTRRPGHGDGITGDTMICGSRRKSSRPAVQILNRQNRPLWNRKNRHNGGETQMTSEQLTWITRGGDGLPKAIG